MPSKTLACTKTSCVSVWSAGTWARQQLLPAALCLILLKRITPLRRKHASSDIVFLRRCGVFLAASIVLLARPLKMFLRLVWKEGCLPNAPGSLPLLGHLIEFSKLPTIVPGIWDYFTKLHSECGRTVRFVIGPECAPVRVFNVTSDAGNVEHILKTNFQNYGKGSDVGSVFNEFLGEGIFVVDGERWKTQRKTAASIFSKRNFSDHMTCIFQQHAQRLVSVLRSRISSHPDVDVEMQELFFALTLDAFCEIGFGFPWNSMASQETHAAAESSGYSMEQRREWARHFDSAQAVIVNRFAYRPFWRLERFLARCQLLPKSHEEVCYIESIKFMNHIVQDILDKRLAESGNSSGSDLLTLFMESTHDRTYLRDIVMNFVIAGRDTTACTLTWLLWELACHPDRLDKARKEVIKEAATPTPDICGPEQILSYEALGKMQYCTACVRETIRLHPPVPSDPKVAFADDVLPDGSLIAAGDYVFYEPYVMARDPLNWGQDASEWKPERWLEMKNEPSTFVNCAFQAGPRICLGRDMAILEAKAVLAQLILSGLQWEVRPGYSPTYRYPSLVLPMGDPGLPMRISCLQTGKRS